MILKLRDHKSLYDYSNAHWDDTISNCSEGL